MNNIHLKEVIEQLIATEKSIVKLADRLASSAAGSPHAKWHQPVERVRANSRTRIRLLRSFAAEFPESSVHPIPSNEPTDFDGMLGSLKGDIREHRLSQVIGDLVIALSSAALNYSLLSSNRMVTIGLGDDELITLAEDGLNSSAESCSDLRGFPPMLLALELNPALGEKYGEVLALFVCQAWAPPED
jgi:hypothetical protein